MEDLHKERIKKAALNPWVQSIFLHLLLCILLMISPESQQLSIIQGTEIAMTEENSPSFAESAKGNKANDPITDNKNLENNSSPGARRMQPGGTRSAHIRERSESTDGTEISGIERNGNGKPVLRQNASALDGSRNISDRKPGQNGGNGGLSQGNENAAVPSGGRTDADGKINQPGSGGFKSQGGAYRTVLSEPDFGLPEEYKGKGIRGEIIFSVVVNEDGRVSSCTPIKRSGYGNALDSVYTEKVRRVKFASAAGVVTRGIYTVKLDLAQ